MRGWIGVDLDGVLAEYNGWVGVRHIGRPVPLMVTRVKQWLKEGVDVRIFTARVTAGEDAHTARVAIAAWCRHNLGQELPITNVKDFGMIALYDDRAYQVRLNTGEIVGEANLF